MPSDFEAEGLLEGTEGKARQGRLALLEDLESKGVPLGELRLAIAEDRLALLPVEHVLTGDGERYTRAEVAERTGLDAAFMAKQWRALGMPEPGPEERAFGQRDLDAAERTKVLLDLEIPEDELLQVSRVIGLTMSQLAAAARGVGVRVFASEEDTELEIGQRFATIIDGLGPLITPNLEYVLQLHLREQIRHVSLTGDPDLEIGIAFADLVGFTKLGERLGLAELGELTDRLGELAGSVASGPVRLVKLIGDAVMLTSNDPAAVLDATLELVAASEEEGEGFPLLRAGVAHGPVVARGGDFYGRPVNLASRITDVARPGSVLCDEATHEAVGDAAHRWSFAGARNLKGITGEPKLWRARAGVTD